ncbi:MAG: D-alanyl-D-alanine carboxypeptidase family protein [Ruminiclostridium sp.]
MENNDKKYETSNIDDIKALFDERKTEEPAPEMPLAKGKDEVKKEKSAVNGKKAENEKKRRNRMIANVMIYSGIGLLIVACAIMLAFIFNRNNGKQIDSLSIIGGNIELRVGHTEKLSVSTKPEGNEYALSFESSDTSVATVSLDGVVTGVNPGKTEITVSSGGLTATVEVTVRKDIIDSLSVSLSALALDGGEEHTVSVSYTPSDAKDINIVWKSEDTETATVDENGVIKGVNTGETVITVTDTVTGKSADVKVTVNGLELPSSMTFDKESVTLEVGEKYESVLCFTPEDITNTSAIFYTTDSSIASVTNEGIITAKGEGSCTIEAYYENDNRLVAYLEVTVIDSFPITDPETSSASKPAPKPDYVPNPDDLHTIEEIDGITYVDGIMIANKTYTLPADYDPGVQPEAQAAFDEMQAAASEDGISLWVISSYRSYYDQEAIYNRYLQWDTKEVVDTYSSRPGHSDHQTGYTFDVNSLEQSFEYDPAGQWLADNCYKYGFIIRYPKGKEDSTGYMYEPWHIRYIGVEFATKVTTSGLSLEEYLGITSKYAD